jgi:hypothetical protein
MTNYTKAVAGNSIARLAACVGMAFVIAGALTPAAAEEASLKDGARKAGHATGSVAREIGHGAKRAGKTIGGAAREGGKEFRRALKGKSD